MKVEVADSISVEVTTKRRADEGGAGPSLFSERKHHGTKRQSFRKVVGDDNAVCFENVETGETVLDMPKDGELVL